MSAPMKFAYADPPYLGTAARTYGKLHPEAAAYDDPETHRRLIERLQDEFPDGWALSMNEPSLPVIAWRKEADDQRSPRGCEGVQRGEAQPRPRDDREAEARLKFEIPLRRERAASLVEARTKAAAVGVEGRSLADPAVASVPGPRTPCGVLRLDRRGCAGVARTSLRIARILQRNCATPRGRRKPSSSPSRGDVPSKIDASRTLCAVLPYSLAIVGRRDARWIRSHADQHAGHAPSRPFPPLKPAAGRNQSWRKGDAVRCHPASGGPITAGRAAPYAAPAAFSCTAGRRLFAHGLQLNGWSPSQGKRGAGAAGFCPGIPRERSASPVTPISRWTSGNCRNAALSNHEAFPGVLRPAGALGG